MECSFHNSNGSFNADNSGLYFAKICQRSDETNGAVSAHAKIADVVEVDNAELTGRVGGRDEVSTDEYIRAARFEQDGAAQVVVILFQRGTFVRNGARPEVEGKRRDEAGRFAAGVGVQIRDSFHVY